MTTIRIYSKSLERRISAAESLVDSLKASIQQQSEILRRIDPSLIDEPRTRSDWKIVKVVVDIFYSIKLSFAKTFSSLALQVSHLDRYKELKETQESYVTILKGQLRDTQKEPSLAPVLADLSSSRRSSLSSFVSFSEDFPPLPESDDEWDDEEEAPSASDAGIASPTSSARALMTPEEEFKASMGSLLLASDLEEENVSYFLEKFFPKVTSFEKSLEHFERGELTHKLGFSGKQKIVTVLEGYPATFMAEPSLLLTLNPEGNELHFSEGSFTAEIQLKVAFMSATVKASLQSVKLERGGVIRLSIKMVDLSKTSSYILEKLGLPKEPKLKVRKELFRQMFDKAEFTAC